MVFYMSGTRSGSRRISLGELVEAIRSGGRGMRSGYLQKWELTVNRCILCPIGILGGGRVLGSRGSTLAVMAVPNIRGTVGVPIIVVVAVILEIAHIKGMRVGRSGKRLKGGGIGRGRWDEHILESHSTAGREWH